MLVKGATGDKGTKGRLKLHVYLEPIWNQSVNSSDVMNVMKDASSWAESLWFCQWSPMLLTNTYRIGSLSIKVTTTRFMLGNSNDQVLAWKFQWPPLSMEDILIRFEHDDYNEQVRAWKLQWAGLSMKVTMTRFEHRSSCQFSCENNIYFVFRTALKYNISN